MTYPEGQTARLQTAVDQLPSVLFADDMVDVSTRLADTFGSVVGQFDGVSYEQLQASINGLKLVGQKLQDEGGGPPDPAHSLIAGLYAKGSDGYTEFLRAYAQAFRDWDDILQQVGTRGNWARDLINGTKSFFRDVKEGAGGLVSDSLLSVFKGLWPVFALVGGIIIAIVIIAAVTKGKVSVR